MPVEVVKVGIVGLGYWGPNLLRNFRSVPSCRVAAMADMSPGRISEHARQYPDVRTASSADELIDDESLDALVFALPAALLPDLACRALEKGKHVLVEKPMAHSLEAGQRMVEVAKQTGLVTMVDFTFTYSPPVRYLRSQLEFGELGVPQYYQSTRINLGRFQPDVDVIWDLVVHDVSILRFLLDRDPVTVMATGRGINQQVDTAHVTLTYADGIQAFIHVSWMAPMKVRMALLACDRGMAVYNDVEPDEKIRMYQVQNQFEPARENPLVPTFRLGEVRIPRLPQEEPLRTVASTFVEAIRGGPRPQTDWVFGARILAVLDAARRSLHSGQLAEVAQGVGAHA